MEKDDLQALIGQGVLQQQPDLELWEIELAELEKSGFLQSLPEQKVFAFSNNLTWEVIYETLLYAERRRLHNLIARHIEKHNEDQVESVAGLLLYHYEKAQVHDKCVLYGAMAGDRAASMFANDDAVDSYQRALTALDAYGRPRVADRSLLYEYMGDVYEIAGRHQDAVDMLTKSLDLWCGPGRGRKPKLVPWKFRDSTREAELCRKIAVSCERQSDYEKSLEWLDEASRRLPARPGRVSAQVYASRSITLFRKGEYQEGIQWGRRALKQARRSGQQADVAYAHTMLASSYAETGYLRKAIGHLEQAVQLYDALNDYPGIAAANSNLASYYGITGQIEASVRHFDVALKADEHMRNESTIAIDHQNLGHVLAIRGRLDEAIIHLEKVTEMHEKGSCRPDLAGAAYIDLCQCKMDKGEKDEAEALLDRGLGLLKRSGQTGLIMDAELQLAELWLAQGFSKKAHDLCIGILERIRKLDAKLYEVRGERILGNALGALGKVGEAIKHLKDSVQIASQVEADHEKAKSLVSLARMSLEHAADNTTANLKKLKQAIEIFSSMGAALELSDAQKLYEEFL